MLASRPVPGTCAPGAGNEALLLRHAEPLAGLRRRQVLEFDVDYVHVDVGKGEHLDSEFLGVNPNGKVPALVDGDVKMWESVAIMAYLSDKADSDLWPRDERQIEIVRWLVWDAAQFTRWGRHPSLREPHPRAVRPRRPRPGQGRGGVGQLEPVRRSAGRAPQGPDMARRGDPQHCRLRRGLPATLGGGLEVAARRLSPNPALSRQPDGDSRLAAAVPRLAAFQQVRIFREHDTGAIQIAVTRRHAPLVPVQGGAPHVGGRTQLVGHLHGQRHVLAGQRYLEAG